MQHEQGNVPPETTGSGDFSQMSVKGLQALCAHLQGQLSEELTINSQLREESQSAQDECVELRREIASKEYTIQLLEEGRTQLLYQCDDDTQKIRSLEQQVQASQAALNLVLSEIQKTLPAFDERQPSYFSLTQAMLTAVDREEAEESEAIHQAAVDWYPSDPRFIFAGGAAARSQSARTDELQTEVSRTQWSEVRQRILSTIQAIKKEAAEQPSDTHDESARVQRK